MITSQQIAKEIDLKRFLSIVEDLPKIEKRTAYNFDLPLTAGGMVMCAYHIAVNLLQTFKGTLTIPLVSVSFLSGGKTE